MNTQQLQSFCKQLPASVATSHGAPANILRYTVGGRGFAHFKTSAPEMWRFSIKVSPDRYLELTDVPGVQPARFLGRHHWVTIVKVGGFPEAYLKELVEWSYRRAADGLSKSARRELGMVRA